ncbi:dynein axonemal heavy chain 7-like [Lycorma delicatula]|uniref:dynein axonemal heavy chain 7-like n=1 Tax=Lycorma delicatula TaxID=130591 RepID=UPI003F5124EB
MNEGSAKRRKLSSDSENERGSTIKPGRRLLTDDVFTLPQELLRTKKKRSPSQQTLHSVKPKLSESLLMYTKLRKEREEFRKRLVDLIFKTDENDKSVNSKEIPSKSEKEILRYYYYIHHGIDTVHVAPIEESWLNHIKNLINVKLTSQQPDNLEKLLNEVKEDFTLSVKKAIVDFVLKDPNDQLPKTEVITTRERSEVKELSKIYSTFNKSRKYLLTNLHILNPLLGHLLDLWFKSYRDLRLVPLASLQNPDGKALELPAFKKTVQTQIDLTTKKLNNNWYPEIQQIFILVTIK